MNPKFCKLSGWLFFLLSLALFWLAHYNDAFWPQGGEKVIKEDIPLKFPRDKFAQGIREIKLKSRHFKNKLQDSKGVWFYPVKLRANWKYTARLHLSTLAERSSFRRGFEVKHQGVKGFLRTKLLETSSGDRGEYDIDIASFVTKEAGDYQIYAWLPYLPSAQLT